MMGQEVDNISIKAYLSAIKDIVYIDLPFANSLTAVPSGGRKKFKRIFLLKHFAIVRKDED